LGNTAIPVIRKKAKLDFAILLTERGREKHPVMLLTMDPSIILLRGTFYKSDLRRGESFLESFWEELPWMKLGW
jgi:hypothetical protein